MAFFLLMWLLGSTAKGDLQGIASYFHSPLKVAMRAAPGAGSSSSIVHGRRQGPDPQHRRGAPLQSAQASRARQPSAERRRKREQAAAGRTRMAALREKIEKR